MAAELSQLTPILMSLLALLGQPVADTLVKKALDGIIEAIGNRFEKDHQDQAIFRQWKKYPNNAEIQSALMDTVRARLRGDPEFLNELAGLVAKSGVNVPSPTQPVPPPAALHRLPADIADFTGRECEVTELLDKAKPAGASPAILVVSGIGGSGKSALAIHAAHLLWEQFSDIQLYVNLRGSENPPLDPTDALAGFLRALGMDDRAIPMDCGERSGLYRSQLSGRRGIILLDNARDEAQVRPLLPGTSDCIVLVTSRRSLSALEGKRADLRLNMLTEMDALALLERLIGKDRVTAELEAAKRIACLCGGLPLAMRIAGGRLETGLPLGQYASRLEDERERLRELRLGDLDVRACFMLSYRNLGSDEARLFRLLGLLPGESFSSEAAIALTASNMKSPWELLERLMDAQLLELVGDARFGFHDLLRLFSRECLEEEGAEGRQAARLRLARSYVQETQKENEWLTPQKRADQVAEPAEKARQSAETRRNGVLKALTWYEEERPNLSAVVEWAYKGRDWETTWLLAENLTSFYNIRGHWAEWERIDVLALGATRKAQNARNEAIILNSLGNVYRLQGEWDKSADCFREALKLHRKLQNGIGESIALDLLANVYRLQGRWDEALATFAKGLKLNRDLNNLYGESIVLGGIGNVYRMQGRWDDALKIYAESLKIADELCNVRGQCITLNNMGLVYSRQGRLHEAEAVLKRSLSMSSQMKLARGDCIALRTLGEVRMLQERWDEARKLLTESYELAKAQYDRRCICQTLNSLGVWYTQQKNHQEANRCFEEALPILREMKDRHGEGLVLLNKSRLFATQNRESEVETLWREALSKLHHDSPEYKEASAWLQKA